MPLKLRFSSRRYPMNPTATTIPIRASTRPEDVVRKRILRCLLYVAAGLLVLLTLARVYTGWRTGVAMTATSGIWTALAVDLKNGVFYRPLYGNLGYGGTRYFPLHFVLQAALMEIGLGPEAAGHALEAVACLALLFGIYRILRRLRVERRVAACVCLLVLAPKSTQIAYLSIRGDLLPTALNVLGLAICMAPRVERRHLFGASLLFTLAFSAKPTSLFGVAAVLLSFLLSGRLRKAMELLLATSLGCAGVLSVMLFATGGRVLAIMRACATAAGFSLLAGVKHLVTWPAQGLPIELAFIVLGFAGLLALPRSKAVSIPALFFVATLVETAVVLGAVGANINHFLDLEVAALIVFAAWLFDNATMESNFGIGVLAFVTFFALSPILWNLRNDDNVGYFDIAYSRGLRDALQFLGKQDKPVLAVNPLLPILAGQRVYLLDPWMFTHLASKNPSFGQPMSDAIQRRQFAAIVLEDDLESRTLSSTLPFEQTREIGQYYQLARRFPMACVYLPRQP